MPLGGVFPGGAYGWGDLMNVLTGRDAAVQELQARTQDTKALAALRGVETQLAQQRLQEENISRQVFAKSLADGAIQQGDAASPDDTPIVSAQKDARRLQQQAQFYRKAAADMAQQGGSLEFAQKLTKDAYDAEQRSRQLLMEARLEQRDAAKQVGSIASGMIDPANVEAFQVGMRQLRAMDPNIDDRYPWDRDANNHPIAGPRSASVAKQLATSGTDAGKLLDDKIKMDQAKQMAALNEARTREANAKAREADAKAAKERSGLGSGKGGGAEGGVPGGVGSHTLRDPETQQIYVVNDRSGKAWEFDPDTGKYKSIPPNQVPAHAGPIGKTGAMGAREAVFTQRELVAGELAARDLGNIAKLPLTASTGIFGGRTQGPGLLDASKETLANAMTSQEVQLYKTMATGFQRTLAAIEAAGLMPSGQLTHQMEGVMFKEGDSQLTKISKLAQIRQIVDAGMEVIIANPRLSETEKTKAKEIRDKLAVAVPYTQEDVIKLYSSDDDQLTLRDVMPKKSGAGGKSASGTVSWGDLK